MCCRVQVKPLDKLLAETMLRIGMFTERNRSLGGGFERKLEDGLVIAEYTEDSLVIRLSPSISSMSQHIGRRVSASVMFEIGWKYASKVDGELWQLANVEECKQEHGINALIAQSLHPFRWEDICLGFRSVFGVV